MKSGCDSKKNPKTRSVELPVLNHETRPPGTTNIARSSVSRWRAAALIGLNLLMAAHIIQWQLTGSTISPIEPSEAMETLGQGAINAGFIFFALAIVATLIFGRFVCGWGCHVLALQDLCSWMLKKLGITPRPFRSRLLIWVPLLVALYMFVWPTVARYIAAPAGTPVIPAFTNHIVVTDYWETFPPVWIAIPFLFVCGFATVYFLGSKGFCTYGCPYGGFFSVADRIAPGKIRVTDACNQCGHCTATCTSNVIVHAEVKQYGMVVDPGCMKCMDCISVCPNDALYFGFGKPSIGTKEQPIKHYSITWPEEIFAAAIFAFSFFAVWDVYQIVPMLMALGIAGITSFIALKASRLFTANDVAFYRLGLKFSGKIQIVGWLFLVVSAAWMGLIAHSGWIRYHERAGAAAFESLQVPDELALSQTDPSQWLSRNDTVRVASGKEQFRLASEYGLFTNVQALPKMAWLEYLSGNTAGSLELLAKASDLQHGKARALSLFYRGAILDRQGRHEEALASLDGALEAAPDLVLAREEKGVALWQLGQKREAVAAWIEAVSESPRLPVANNLIAGALYAIDRNDEAAGYESQADQYTPNDPSFHWMIALRLQDVGMNDLAKKHFNQAIRLDPLFRSRMMAK